MRHIFALQVILATIPGVTGSLPATLGARQHPLFGIRAGADPKTGPKDDYERAEKAIFHGMEQVEATLQKAVEEEVHSIFDAEIDHDDRKKVADHAKTAVKKGASKVKSAAREYYKAQHEPLWPAQDVNNTNVEHQDHNILHAIEAAEKAVLQAVQDEVDTLFHETQHEHHPLKDQPPKAVKKAKHGVERGVQKAKKHMEESQEIRQGWIVDKDSNAVEEYMKSANSMYNMGF